jgi:hypothetical protein
VVPSLTRCLRPVIHRFRCGEGPGAIRLAAMTYVNFAMIRDRFGTEDPNGTVRHRRAGRLDRATGERIEGLGSSTYLVRAGPGPATVQHRPPHRPSLDHKGLASRAGCIICL